MKKTSLFLMLAIAVCVSVLAQQTTRKGLKALPKAETEKSTTTVAEALDTIVSPDANAFDINGYDKPLRSRRETFFATNNSGKRLDAMAFTIRYYDNKRRMLHSASHRVSVDIPSGETRQVSLRSWDPQFNFYYIRSAVPQRATQATPYDVTITVDTLFVASDRK